MQWVHSATSWGEEAVLFCTYQLEKSARWLVSRERWGGLRERLGVWRVGWESVDEKGCKSMGARSGRIVRTGDIEWVQGAGAS